jgi:SAM-dependent methyltransferase
MAEDSFAGQVANHYDETSAEQFAPDLVEPAVELLAGLADGGAALELGIGTGRIALPLARRGGEVHGLDLSPDMVEQLRAKPGGAEIPVTVGDMASTRVDGTFALVYVVWNSIMNLRTQDSQVACVRNAAEHLVPHGRLVVEIMLPELRRLPPGETVVPFAAGPEHVGFDEYDVARQGLTSHHYYPQRGGYETFPGRYLWPAELDLMAQLAGMSLRERWGGWRREPFTGESTSHVSVYEKTGT